MPQTKPPYPPQLKAEAVRLVRESGKPMAQIARDLGVSVESLRNWTRQAKIDAGEREGLTTAEREELTRLRRENRILREEREILRKVAAFFATLETELLDRRSWPSRQALASAIFGYIEGFCNRKRRHSTLGYLGPAYYERR